MNDDVIGRDRALDFRWSVPHSLLWVTGIPDNADKLYDQARRSILAAACIAADERPADDEAWWISYSRRRDFYQHAPRYLGLPYSYDRVTRAVEEGVAHGLLEEDRAAPQPPRFDLAGTRAEPSGLALTAADAALIRGMILRGDRHHDIAAFFGVNQGRIAEIKDGTRFPGIAPADSDDLPPTGPYMTPKSAWQENRLR